MKQVRTNLTGSELCCGTWSWNDISIFLHKTRYTHVQIVVISEVYLGGEDAKDMIYSFIPQLVYMHCNGVINGRASLCSVIRPQP